MRRDPTKLAATVDDTAEAFRYGGTGVSADLAAASQPWGFPLRDVKVPTWLWHGTADQDVPVATARRIAQTIPGCWATFTDEGHLMGLRHASKAVQAIKQATAS
jgi:pimeloyl-ACP methyl ester carboxylesterase